MHTHQSSKRKSNTERTTFECGSGTMATVSTKLCCATALALGILDFRGCASARGISVQALPFGPAKTLESRSKSAFQPARLTALTRHGAVGSENYGRRIRSVASF